MTFVTTSTSPFLATDGVAGIVHVPTELTVAQAAKFLGIPESDLIELLDIGEIESRQIGN